MKIFRALRTELQKHKLTPAAIMPVAGIDPGTLEDRFTGIAWRGSVIAKTGTLIRTDGGASSLVGQMRAANGEELLFVIMNQRGSVWRFRENQDYLVMLVQNTRGGPKAFDTAVAYANGEKLPDKIINPDQFYDASNAKELLSTAY